MELFDANTLYKLEQLSLVANKVRVGVMKGDRRSSKRGSSIEFADYRSYVQGDDLRRVDWNVFARLERPFIKLLEEEEDLAVHILIDSSLSMDWPESPEEENKFVYGLRLAGALGHIALTSGDQLFITLMQNGNSQLWGPHRGRTNAMRMLMVLEQAKASGVVDLNRAASRYAYRNYRPGLLFLISDFFSPGGYQGGLNLLESRGFEVVLIHVLSMAEIDPSIRGDVKLIDVETGAEAEMTLDSATLARYRRRLVSWQTEMADHAARRNIHYVPVNTSFPWEKLILQTIRTKGILK